RRVRAGLPRPDGGGAAAPPRRAGAGAVAAARLLALRRLHGRVSRENPLARAAARAAPRSCRAGRGAAGRAGRLRALVARVVLAARLPGLDAARPSRPASGGVRRARAHLGRGPVGADARPPLSRPMSVVDEFAANAEAAGFVVHHV